MSNPRREREKVHGIHASNDLTKFLARLWIPLQEFGPVALTLHNLEQDAHVVSVLRARIPLTSQVSLDETENHDGFQEPC